ncbi:hypothetical protein M5K25_023104 [Dendrobium thyrsiflorum]|uniref:Uncharacterized protein n=1 Tax=Dendrobium thyrsiflorum TaxID=117978 RepID=A0ABD0UDY7_DENTH
MSCPYAAKEDQEVLYERIIGSHIRKATRFIHLIKYSKSFWDPLFETECINDAIANCHIWIAPFFSHSSKKLHRCAKLSRLGQRIDESAICEEIRSEEVSEEDSECPAKREPPAEHQSEPGCPRTIQGEAGRPAILIVLQNLIAMTTIMSSYGNLLTNAQAIAFQAAVLGRNTEAHGKDILQNSNHGETENI